MVKKISFLLVSFLLGFPAYAQLQSESKTYVRAFNNLDLSLSVGVTGLGFEFSSPLSKSFTLRSGLQYIPKFKPTMSFGVGLDGKKKPDGSYEKIPKSKLDEVLEIFEGVTGCPVDDRIDMICEPTSLNFSLLLDFAPFKDKRWHFTAGLFAGPSQVFKAYNTTEDMPSLFSINMYNRIYESAYNEEPLFVYGDNAISIDPEVAEKVLNYGRMSIKIGDKADGSGPCKLAPNNESMVKVRMKVKPVRPYLGFGFGNVLGKKNSSRYSFAFDAGVMFWGGTPQILTKEFVEHEYVDEYGMEKVRGELVDVDLAKDVVNIRGKAGKYVRFMKSFKVCPMLNFKITRRLF